MSEENTRTAADAQPTSSAGTGEASADAQPTSSTGTGEASADTQPTSSAGTRTAEATPAVPEEAAAEEAAAGEPAAPAEDDAPEDAAAEYLALAQRTQADFENFRKRMARENAAAIDRGVGKLAKELLPALDHLELALKASEGHEEVVRGFALVRDEIVNALSRVGIQPFAPHGEPFDPTEHEAMASQPSEGAEPGSVIEVYQQGYRINGAVLRPARVVVAA